MRRLILISFMTIIAALIPSAAQGTHDPYQTNTPQVNWPWSPHPNNPDQTITYIATEGRNTMGDVQKVIASIEERVAGVRFAPPSVTCDDRPRFNCLSFRADYYGQTGWKGLTDQAGDNTRHRRIFINLSSGQPYQNLMCHELGHAVGIMHHMDVGCTLSSHNSNSDTAIPSWPEIRAMREYYNNLG